MKPKTTAVAASTAAMLICATLGAASPAQAVPTQVLWFRFDNHSLNTQPATFTNYGTLGASVTSKVHSVKATSPNVDYPATIVNGVSNATGGFPSGRAIDLPPYQQLLASPSPSFQVIGITNSSESGTDPMSPGTGDFTWKADFRLDDYLGTVSSDGDNIVQRGLYSGYLWKMSADGHKFLCTVKAPGNGNEIETPAITVPNITSNRSWHRGRCNRSAAGILTATLQVFDKAQNAWASVKTVTKAGAGVDFTPMPRNTPVSVGGKLNSTWTGVNSEPDQFNGVIDNIALTVG